MSVSDPKRCVDSGVTNFLVFFRAVVIMMAPVPFESIGLAPAVGVGDSPGLGLSDSSLEIFSPVWPLLPFTASRGEQTSPYGVGMEDNDDDNKGEGKRNNILQRALILYIGHVSLEPRGCERGGVISKVSGRSLVTRLCAWRLPGADRNSAASNRHLPSKS